VGKLIYSAITSLDGFTEDETGNFDWAAPDDEVHGFFNAQQRSLAVHLYGRRMYETMMVWETDPDLAASSPLMEEFATDWQAADKIVYSRTLERASTQRTSIEREFEAQQVRHLKERAAGDLVIGGPLLAAEAFKAGLVDECQVTLVPVVVGRGKRALPDDLHIELDLLDERRFASGFVYLCYAVRARPSGS